MMDKPVSKTHFKTIGEQGGGRKHDFKFCDIINNLNSYTVFFRFFYKSLKPSGRLNIRKMAVMKPTS